MATVEAPQGSVFQRQQRACELRLQAGAGPFSGQLLVVRGGVQLHLDPDRRHRAVLFGYLNAGPGVWWTWPVVVGGQILVALCFMEMAAQYPIAGSVYQWSKQLSSGYTSWMTGWIYIVGAIVTIAAVAVDWQVVLPQITTKFQFFGVQRRRRHVPDQGRGPERAAARRDPGRDHDGDQHARRQADVAHQQRRRRRRADRLDAADHPAPVPPAPSPVGHHPQLRLRRRPPVGLLRRAADRRAAERVRDVRVRHGRDARRGDQQPAQARAAGDHPRDRGGRDDRRPGDPARRSCPTRTSPTRTSGFSACPM